MDHRRAVTTPARSRSQAGAMTNHKTFVLVPGSWQGAWSWDGVRERLLRHGHRVLTPALPGRGAFEEDRSWIGHDDNVAAVLPPSTLTAMVRWCSQGTASVA